MKRLVKEIEDLDFKGEVDVFVCLREKFYNWWKFIRSKEASVF